MNSNALTYRWQRPVIAALAGIGILDTGYLVAAHAAHRPLACPNAGVFSCDAVVSSGWSVVLGVPLAGWGLAAYLLILFLAALPWLARRSGEAAPAVGPAERWSLSALRSVATMLFFAELFLGFLMFGVIGTLCPFCLVSLLLSIGIFACAGIAPAGTRFSLRTLTSGLILAATSIYLIAAAPPPLPKAADTSGRVMIGVSTPDDRDVVTESGTSELALARHLTDVGSEMYGAYDCPHCILQKRIFGKQAWALIRYIECNPKGQNARPDLCNSVPVEQYPTWVVGTPVGTEFKGYDNSGREFRPRGAEDDGEVGLFKYEGARDLDELANFSSYQGPRNFHRAIFRMPGEEYGPDPDEDPDGPQTRMPAPPALDVPQRE